MLRKNDSRRTGRGRRRAPARAALGALLLAGAVAISGCGSTGGGGDSAEAVRADDPAVDQEVADSDAKGQTGPGASDSSQSGSGQDAGHAGNTADTARAAERHVIRTATLTVELKDVQAGLDEARSAVDTAGGYVSQESTDRDSDGEERSQVVFKVPPEEYGGVLDSLAGIGDLVERKRSAEDVTGEVVDVESRIKSQKASVSRIRDLMDDATELTDVVTLESELSTRQADLEALQARLKSLESQSGMATVTLELRTPDAAPVEEDEDPSVGGAVTGGWDAFVSMLRWIAIAIGASLPFVVMLALLYVLWRVVRTRLPQLPRPAGGALPKQPATPARTAVKADPGTRE
jgi:hypothetical protein